MSLETEIARRLIPGKKEEFKTAPIGIVWNQFTNALDNLSDQQKRTLVNAAIDGKTIPIGKGVVKVIQDKLESLCLSEATAMLADDQLSRTELSKIL